MEVLYIILLGAVIIALISFVISYREDHPKRRTITADILLTEPVAGSQRIRLNPL